MTSYLSNQMSMCQNLWPLRGKSSLLFLLWNYYLDLHDATLSWYFFSFSDHPFLGCTTGSFSVLVCLGYHTKFHRLGGFINRNFFLTVLEARSPRSKSNRVRFWSELSSSLADSRLLAVSSHGLLSVFMRGKISLSLPLFIWPPIPLD